MTLNCKPGDMARVVRDAAGHDPRHGIDGIVHIGGCIVRVVESFVDDDEHVWVLEDPLESKVSTPVGDFPCTVTAIPDGNLRPLPGLGELAGEDLTMAWAGKPAQIEGPVTA